MFYNIEIISFFLILSIILLWITINYKNFIKIYTLQVFLILIVFYLSYHNSFSTDTFLMLSFIFAIVVRWFFIPWALYYFVKNSSLPVVEREFRFGIFFTMLIYFVSLWLISYLSLRIFWQYNFIFISAFFMLVSWFLNFANHKKLIWDILSFLELENGVFLLSLLVLEKINFYIDFGIVIDILMSLTILMISTIKIKQVYWSIDIDKLSELKD